MKKILMIIAVCALVALQSIGACTIFAVGKKATVDGSTMTSHTCDSTSDDLRMWLIPSMKAGTERDIVLDSRVNADYGAFPEVKDYGDRGIEFGSYTFEKDSNQYLHAMYSFINDKGLAMGESTCARDGNSDQGKAVSKAFSRDEGIIDCYMIQDAALENCSTAREAVLYMGAMIDEYGWNGSTECINICDGNEAWVMECYGGNIWVAARVPDDSVFVAANRARINFFVENDPDNYLYHKGIKEYAKENGLWDGKGDFIPCYTFAPFPYRPYSTRREWRAMTLLNSSLDLDPEEKDTDHNWPCFVKPDHLLTVADIKDICSDYYAGTVYDTTASIWGGQFGDPLNPAQDFTQRAINSYRCTYFQIAQINASLPEEVRCLAWFGYGAPSTGYLTPVFASVNSIPESFNRGMRGTYDEKSGWWNSLLVQQLSRINYASAIEDVKAVRDPKLEKLYEEVPLIQTAAAELVNVGRSDMAKELLTTYTAEKANDWFDTYKNLSNTLIGKYMLGTGRNYTEWWKTLSASEYGQYL